MATCTASTSTRFLTTASCRMNRRGTTRTVPMVSGGSSGIQNVRRIPLQKNRRNSRRLMMSSSSFLSPPTSPCTLMNNTPVVGLSSSLTARATSTAVFDENLGVNDKTMRSEAALFLSSALLAGVFGFVAAHSTPGTADAVSSAATSTTRIGRSGGGGNGGGGPNKVYTSFLQGRKNAEDDVRKFELEALKKPYTVSTGAVQGARWSMEDEYKIANGGRFAAVFDGHGGNAVSRALRDRLYEKYSRILSFKHWEERDDLHLGESRMPSLSCQVGALRGALEEVDREVMKEDSYAYQGSTAVAVVLHASEDGHRTLLSANVGDSRAVLSRGKRAVDLTRDHKPNDERERNRILAQGEELQWDPHAQLHRVRSLSLSRAIGDRFAKPAVSGEAEIRHFPVNDDDDEFIILASDGLWDVMTSQEVVDYVHGCLSDEHELESLSEEDRAYFNFVQCKNMARKVANEALERGSQDNVCVLVVWLGDQTASFEK